MNKEDEILEKINQRLADFKAEFDPIIAIEIIHFYRHRVRKAAEILMKHNPGIATLCIHHPDIFDAMMVWIGSREVNNTEILEILKTIGIELPNELGYVFAIGLEEDIQIIVNHLL